MQKQDRNAPVCGAAPRVGCSGCRSGGCDGPTVFVWERSGCRFGRQLRLGSSVGFVVGAVVGPAGCPAGRPVARSCLFWDCPGGTQQETAGGLAGPCWKRVWLSVPCVALGSVCGARSRVRCSVPCLALVGSGRRFGGAFVPVPAAGGPSGCPGGAIAPPRSS